MKGSGAWVLWGFSAVVLGCFSAADAVAQEAPSLRAHRVLLEGGVVWSGGYAIGDADAQLRTNASGTTPPAFTLFSASSGISRAAGASVRIGFTLTPRVTIEGGGSFARPRVGVEITQDTEAGSLRLDGEQLQQYFVDGAVVWHLPLRMGPRVRPFVVGGGGYLRQLHEERTLVETGQIYYAGVGARYWIRGGAGNGRAFGLRGDLRANLRRGGVDFENKVRVFPTVAVHLFVSV